MNEVILECSEKEMDFVKTVQFAFSMLVNYDNYINKKGLDGTLKTIRKIQNKCYGHTYNGCSVTDFFIRKKQPIFNQGSVMFDYFSKYYDLQDPYDGIQLFYKWADKLLIWFQIEQTVMSDDEKLRVHTSELLGDGATMKSSYDWRKEHEKK